MDAVTRITGMNWLPFHGWAVSAGDLRIPRKSIAWSTAK
jgi:roadblock/LC7 domain-containing protein